VPQVAESEAIKSCCATAYGSEWARLLIGDSMHPGGAALTERLGSLIDLGTGSRVLDVASGRGASALLLARRFGCEVVGVDLSPANVAFAREQARGSGLDRSVRFEVADAELLPFDDGEFSAVICECAFCTFPTKAVAASEMARVLAPGGGVGISDLTRSGALPRELEGLLAWVACIADAGSLAEYATWLEGAGLSVEVTEPHDQALVEMVEQIRARILAAELAVALRHLELPGVDLGNARAVARSALAAIRSGRLGYAVVTARKPV